PSATPPAASAVGWTTVTSSTNYNGSLAYTLASGEGSKAVYAWYETAAGNVAPTAAASILLDQTVPSNGTLTPTAASTQVTLNWSGFTDAGSGLATTTPYKLVYATDPVPASCTSSSLTFPDAATSFIHSGLTNGTT